MTIQELKEKQGWSLQQKIDHSLGVIDQFISNLGEDNVYVAFSGGKDSTVLLDLCRIISPNIKAVFCNTGNEYPDIVKFVRKQKQNGVNLDIIYPEMKIKDVLSKYGFPLISKVQSMAISRYRNTKSDIQKNYRLYGDGERKAGVIAKKWHPMTAKPYDISEKCCDKLKKRPFYIYSKNTGRMPIIGDMASESQQRRKTYIQRGGCNSFSGKISSHPLSIWSESDIYEYINMRNLKIADIYHKGLSRTGCMFCGYGIQFKGDNRFDIVYSLYPKAYKMFMDYNNKGFTYRQAVNDIYSICGKTLPDEKIL